MCGCAGVFKKFYTPTSSYAKRRKRIRQKRLEKEQRVKKQKGSYNGKEDESL